MIIYKTTNLINGKIYIGQDSKNNPNYIGSGKILKRAIIKYGKYNFRKEILEKCQSKTELNEKEIYWIDKLNTTNLNIGYNLTLGGEGSNTWNGHTQEQIENRKSKMSMSLKGQKRTDEARKNISKSLKGRKLSNIHKQNIGKSKEGNKYNLGKTLSDEHKQKISESNKGIKRPRTQEQIEKHKKAVTGKRHHEDYFKPILQYNLKNTLIANFETADIAGTSNNIKAQYIIRCARGIRKTYSKFIWKFK